MSFSNDILMSLDGEKLLYVQATVCFQDESLIA